MTATKEENRYSIQSGIRPAEYKYLTIEKELIAVIKGIEHFRYILIYRKFTLRIYNKNIKYLQNTNKEKGRFTRQALTFQEIDFCIEHILSKKNLTDRLNRVSEVTILNIEKEKDDNEKI